MASATFCAGLLRYSQSQQSAGHPSDCKGSRNTTGKQRRDSENGVDLPWWLLVTTSLTTSPSHHFPTDPIKVIHNSEDRFPTLCTKWCKYDLNKQSCMFRYTVDMVPYLCLNSSVLCVFHTSSVGPWFAQVAAQRTDLVPSRYCTRRRGNWQRKPCKVVLQFHGGVYGLMMADGFMWHSNDIYIYTS